MSRSMAAILGAGVFLAAAAGAAGGAPIGPDSNGYYADNVTYNWVEIAAPGPGQGTAILAGASDDADPVPIGFTFSFYGAPYTTAYVSDNGLVALGGADVTYVNQDLSGYDPNYPMDYPLIAPLWDDWDAAGTSAFYKTDGAAGSRRLIVQWEAFKHWPLPDPPGASGPVTFQMVLYEDTSDILFQYKDVNASNAAYDFGASASVGIRALDGDLDGSYLQWSYNSAVLTDEQAILFYIPEPATLLILAAGASAAALRRRRRS